MQLRRRAVRKKNRGRPGRQKVSLVYVRIGESLVRIRSRLRATWGTEYLQFPSADQNSELAPLVVSGTDREAMWDCRFEALKSMVDGAQLVVVRIKDDEFETNEVLVSPGVKFYDVGLQDEWCVITMLPDSSVILRTEDGKRTFALHLSERGEVSCLSLSNQE